MKTTRMFVAVLCGIAMILGADSCKKEKQENGNVGEEMRIEASLGGTDGNTKTHLEGLSVIWDSRDAFTLYSGSDGSIFRISPNEAGGTTATFIGFRPGPMPYYACYPSNATRIEDGFTFTVDEDQSDNMADISKVSAGPMVAYYTGEGNLTFKNAMSWLNIGLKGNAVVKKMELTDKSAGAKLNGKMTVKMDKGDITGWTMAEGEGSNTLFIASEEGIQLHDGATDDVYTWFRFLVPVNSFKETEAVEIKVYGADPLIPIKTFAKTLQHDGVQGVEENKIYSPKVSESINFIAPTVTLTDECVNCKQVISGKVTVSGSAQYCEYGIVYSKTEARPEIGKTGCAKLMADAESISGSKDFSVDLAPLNDGPYYVRTYVIAKASAYSDVLFLDTPKPLPSTWANGKNPHPFTVGMDGSTPRKVYFSQANLQYNATGSTSTVSAGENVGGKWRFAEHQYDIIGADNANAAQTYGGWIDLFGWGTSGYNHNNKSYQPWSTSQTYTDYIAYATQGYNLYDGSGTADWGHNTIQNGGTNSWRTLTKGEWSYLIDTRKDGSGNVLYGEGKVGPCMNGLIVLPDDWDWSKVHLSSSAPTWVPGSISYSNNNYNYADWKLMEAEGAMFLPSAGSRDGIGVRNVNSVGYYQSSTFYDVVNIDPWCAWYFRIDNTNVSPNSPYGILYHGFSVRLVSDIAPAK